MDTSAVSLSSQQFSFRLGQTLGDYEILSLLGSGRLGPVYQVFNTVSRRVEAMKVLLPDLCADSAWTDRLFREMQSWASLVHTNIAAPRVAQRIDGQVVLLTEFVKGSTLDALIHGSRIALKDAVDYFSQALCGVAYAHSMGVLHRDIKPSNIMLTAEGTVKLMDFGIAALAIGRRVGMAGVPGRSVQYMSPEQIQGRYLDPRSDIYSLGITLYQLVTGERPFEGDTEDEIMAAHLELAPRPPNLIDRALPAELNEIILTALAKDPAQRFQTATAFHAALSKVALQFVILPEKRVRKPFLPHMWKGPRISYGTANLLVFLAVLAAIAVVEIPKYRRAQPDTQPVVVKQEPPQGRSSPARAAASDRTSAKSSPRSSSASAAAPEPAAASGEPATSSPSNSPASVAESPDFLTSLTGAASQPETSLVELHARMARISARGAAVAIALQNLQTRRVSIPAEIMAAQQRLISDIHGAEVSLNRNDALSAKLTLDGAERDLEQIESFLRQ